VVLDQGAKKELQWWVENLPKWNGRLIILPPPDVVIETDPSTVGWGAVCRGVRTGGLWSPQEQGTHINVLELTAGMFAVQSFLKDQSNLHVHLRMDNTSALTYVRKMGGTRSPRLMKVACQLWDWCLHRGIILSASHLPGVINLEADQESREVKTSAEWMPNKEVFQRTLGTLGPCKVDLFATRLNHQLPNYVSWRPDPGAMETDAFQIHWKGMGGYASPHLH